jgi:hypothetical protein
MCPHSLSGHTSGNYNQGFLACSGFIAVKQSLRESVLSDGLAEFHECMLSLELHGLLADECGHIEQRGSTGEMWDGAGNLGLRHIIQHLRTRRGHPDPLEYVALPNNPRCLTECLTALQESIRWAQDDISPPTNQGLMALYDLLHPTLSKHTMLRVIADTEYDVWEALYRL